MENDQTGAQEGTSDQGNQPDLVTNIKAEMSRKFENTNAELQALKAQLAQALATKQPTPTVEEDFDVYDPQAVKKAVGQVVKSELSAYQQQVQVQQAQEAKRIQAINSLVPEYPELQDPNSELVQEARKIMDSFDPAEQVTAAATKAAILEAAMRKGVTPKSKRTSQSNDSFTVGGSKPASSKSRKDDEIPQNTQAWMELLSPHLSNINFNDEKTQKRIKERSDFYKRGKK